MALAAARQAHAQDVPDGVLLELGRFGPGNVAREGSWTGLRLDVTDQGLSPQREIVLRVRVPDPDGDEADYDRVVTSNAGLVQSFWLYFPVPTAGSGLDSLEVVAYEAEESDSDARFGFRAGRVLGRNTISLSRAIPASSGVIGVVGPARMGLDDYGPAGNISSYLPLGHEVSRLASGLEVSDIPDRWQGLSALDVLCWTSTRGEADPGQLTTDKARAVRDWVERGGHLVIVLPSVGQEWFSTVGNPLAPLIPNIKTPRTIEGFDLNSYRAMLTSDRETRMPTNGVVRFFEPGENAGPGEAMPVLNDPEGRCIVMRRLLGAGAVTLVGVDLNLSGLRAAGLPDAEVFWHRVLGRRGQLLTPDEAAAKGIVQFPTRLESRVPIQLDVDLEDQIAMRGTAAMGVALGFVVFLLYWLVAGPVGYMLLGRAGMKRHAWTAFVGSVAAFTVISWAAATASRPHKASIRHITLLHGVYGQSTQRARSWMAILTPFYGQAEVSTAPADEAGPGSNLVAPLRTSAASLALGGFPDNRSYRVESRQPDEIVFPARSTVKELVVDWAGSGDEGWSLPRPIGQPGDLEEPRLRATAPDEFKADGTRVDYEVEGELIHNLPAPLEDVLVLVNTGQVTMFDGAQLGANLSANVLAFELPDPWPPGTRLSMADVTRRGATQGGRLRQRASAYLESLLASENPGPAGGIRPDERRLSERLKALALFPQLGPPEFGDGPGVRDRLARRDRTHGYDLGMWFTQPSVMVLGRVSQSGREATSVVPVRLGGDRVPAEGTTFVIWVYPLDPAPPEVRTPGSSE
ncbi:MAG: hypothetical protein DYG94_09675 [Leptolyngbya sp. PLA3]|nr:MAG: hypothetical protein EDM82_08020 [Cyanobacteria bacterium CYA]MCE7968998.1 hypothetical protein [Leptolyngbya sp. PL-A3]